jgi:sec-independent protein translocase protein TatA
MNLAFIQGIGPLELVIVLVIVLVIFGPKRLPALARQVGTGIRELKRSVAERDGDDEDPKPGTTGASRATLGAPREPVADARPVEGEVSSDRR